MVRNVAPAEAAEDADNDNGDYAQRQIIFAATLLSAPTLGRYMCSGRNTKGGSLGGGQLGCLLGTKGVK
jgi:hypothetical protein